MRAAAIFRLFTAILLLPEFASAQDPAAPGYEGGSNLNVLYRNEMSGKIFATTRGIGVMFRQAKHVTSTTKSFYDIDLQTLRHPKELKIPGEAESRKRFVYGKVNSVLLLHATLGLQNVLYQKGDQKSIEVRYAYSIGPVLAFAKPYYVQIYKNSTVGSTLPLNERFDSENFSPDSSRIVGRAPFTQGLAELKVYPGVSGRFNLSFEYAPYTNMIRAIETGISLDYFPHALPIMARNPAENFVLTFHVGFVFGRKWF
jgi:hypothetical protein